jgi:hypothetical protein
MRSGFNSIGLIFSFALLWIGFQALLNPERLRMKYVESFQKFPRMHEALLAGKWLFSRPRFHRGMIVFLSLVIILMGFISFFLSVFGNSTQ